MRGPSLLHLAAVPAAMAACTPTQSKLAAGGDVNMSSFQLFPENIDYSKTTSRAYISYVFPYMSAAQYMSLT
jgi:hypothetical protein